MYHTILHQILHQIMNVSLKLNEVIDEHPILLNLKYDLDIEIQDDILAKAFNAVLYDSGTSQCSFSKTNDLNRGNFSRWLLGKRKGNDKKFRESVISFIRKALLEDFAIVKKDDEHHSIESSILNQGVLPRTIDGSHKSWRRHIYDLNPNSIAFIDGDNTKTRNCAEINIIFCNHVGFGRIMNEYMMPNSFVYKTLTCCKDAADVALCMEISLFDEIMPDGIDFIIASDDGFIAEVKGIINRNKRRECICIP